MSTIPDSHKDVSSRILTQDQGFCLVSIVTFFVFIIIKCYVAVQNINFLEKTHSCVYMRPRLKPTTFCLPNKHLN